MTFSEALEQYLDARDKLAALAHYVGAAARVEREYATAALNEAAQRMNELMPGDREVER